MSQEIEEEREGTVQETEEFSASIEEEQLPCTSSESVKEEESEQGILEETTSSLEEIQESLELAEEEVEVEEIEEEMPIKKTTTTEVEVQERENIEEEELVSAASEEDVLEGPRKRRQRVEFSPSNESPSRSPRTKRVKVEVEELDLGLEEEAPEDEEEDEDVEDDDDASSGGSSSATPPRVIPRRNCAEAAKMKIKKEKVVKTEPQPDSIDSREGSCERSECALVKVCCLALENSCISSNTDPRLFYHLSKSEHVCHVCYDILWKQTSRFGKKYSEWKAKWSEESRCHPGVKSFIMDQLLPYWIKCTSCGVFRKHEADKVVSSEFMTNFECGRCKEPEEASIADAKERSWIYSIASSPLLQNSPSLFYLQGGHYFYDELGLSPVEQNFHVKECSTTGFMSPFNIPEQQSKAFCLRPDMMDYDEVLAFPEYCQEAVLYLAVRNLIVTLWNMNPYKYLTLDECISHLICRGLARVWYIHEMSRIYQFLCMKSIVNYGILDVPTENPIFAEEKAPLEVIVIGAGISGLSAARQLRSFGANVKVLEAKHVIGGRMQDDWSLGVAVGCGAQLVTGSINNPIILMCQQTGVKYRILDGGCPLIDGKEGGLIDWKVDKYVEEHFDCILDALYHWKKNRRHGDASLEDRVSQVHSTLLEQGEVKWGETEERVLQFHFGNIEFSCGSKMNDVSWRHWDQNEAVALFAGAHALLTDGSGEILKRLAEGTDVRLNHEVTKIEWSEKKKATVHCQNGKKFTADKVLVALPLAVLKKRKNMFAPQLPKKKQQSMSKIGAGLIEKVAVKFPRKFWSKVVAAKSGGEANYFSLVPRSGEERGLFNMFYDFSTKDASVKNQHFVLMSYVCGDSVDIVNQLSDGEVVDKFVDALRDMFPEEDVPDPEGYVVTHWGKDPHIGMSYSYVRVGGTGENYDQLADSVGERLYFAGECTNRFFPQTMTGAYLSGLREAGKMMEDYCR